MKQFSKKQSISRLEEFVRQMWIYFRDKNVDHKTNPLHHAAKESKLEFMQLLIDSGIDLNMKSLHGYTATHHACLKGNSDMVRLLLKHDTNAATQVTTDSRDTIFHLAAKNADPRVLQIVLDTCEFEDSKNVKGMTMLHIAVKYGPKETIEFLIESHHKIGFKLDEKIHNGLIQGFTILHLACKNRDIDIIDLIYKALQDNHIEIDFDTRETGPIASTPLLVSVMNNLNVFINLTNRYPEKTEVRFWPTTQGTHLAHNASSDGELQFLRHIFENSAFNVALDVVDNYGNTPLHCACFHGQIEVVKYLLQLYEDKGIDIYAKNNNNITAEEKAKQKGHANIVALFEAERHQRGITESMAKRAKYYHSGFLYDRLVQITEKL